MRVLFIFIVLLLYWHPAFTMNCKKFISFENIHNCSKKALKRLEVTKNRYDFNKLIIILDIYNLQFDKLDLSISDTSYFNENDKRIQIMQEFQMVLAKVNKKIDVNPPKHPYTRLYVYKSELMKELTDRIFRFSNFDETLNFKNLGTLERTFFEYFRLNGAPSVWNYDNHADTTNKASLQYQRYLYLSEINHFMIELVTNDYGVLNNINSYDTRRYLYGTLRRSLYQRVKKALYYRYNNRLNRLDDWTSQYKIHRINETTGDENESIIIDLKDKKMDLKPGVYELESDLQLYAREIRFHPLSVIYGPGKNVFLNTRLLINPWIDTSANNVGTHQHGEDAGHIELVIDKGGSIRSSILLVAMGGHATQYSCYDNTLDHWRLMAGNGGNGGRIFINAYHDAMINKLPVLLNFSGGKASYYCNGRTLYGEDGIPGKIDFYRGSK